MAVSKRPEMIHSNTLMVHEGAMKVQHVIGYQDAAELLYARNRIAVEECSLRTRHIEAKSLVFEHRIVSKSHPMP